MKEGTTVIRARWGVAIAQAAFATLGAAGVGFLLRNASCFQRDPLRGLAGALNLPVAVLTCGLLGAIVAGVFIADVRRHRIVLRDTFFTLRNAYGLTAVRYGNIREIKKLRDGSVGIALDNTAQWLLSHQGKVRERQALQRVTSLNQRLYGCDLVIFARHMNVTADEFLRLLEDHRTAYARLSAARE
jgi:hypothetical protein